MDGWAGGRAGIEGTLRGPRGPKNVAENIFLHISRNLYHVQPVLIYHIEKILQT